MRSSIVPAQITTVEDKVMGSLSLAQLLLLSSPIFIGSLIYFVFPPSLTGALYKTILTAIGTVILWALAIRFKGRLLIEWAITIGRYNRRPRYNVNDKNDLCLRELESQPDASRAPEKPEYDHEEAYVPAPMISLAEAVFLEKIITNPKANLHFKTDRRGELRVHINEDK
jgi:hypothetical protein